MLFMCDYISILYIFKSDLYDYTEFAYWIMPFVMICQL